MSKLRHLPRFVLAQLPTPLEHAPRLSSALGGPDIWIKRDDLTGLALGGNKVRKLEFLVGDAIHAGADTLLTAGAVQSNHCRQTAAAAAKVGLSCELVLGGKPPEKPNGNLLLNRILGATEHWVERSQRNARLQQRAEELRAQGKKPYVIPIGGSNGVGATGYVVAMLELIEQMREPFDHVLFGSSSSGTQAGLILGARISGFKGSVQGLSIDKNDPEHFEYEDEVAQVANDCASYIGSEIRIARDDVKVIYGYKGEGYGVVGDLEREAVRLMARTEGIILDPVYAGRAFGAFVDLVRRGKFKRGERVVFWHTGGTPALFAYADEMLA